MPASRRLTPALRGGALEFSAVLAALLAAGFWMRPEDPFFLDIQPHPFWIPVLLTALRCGMPLASVAGVVCAAIEVLGLGLRGVRIEEAFQLEIGLLLTPILYILVGTSIGEAIEKGRSRAAALEKALAEQRDRLATAEARRSEVEVGYRHLEGRIAGATDTVANLCESARDLDAPDEAGIHAGLLRVLERHLEVSSAGLWAVEGTETRQVWPPDESTPLPALGLAALRAGAAVGAHDIFRSGDEGARGGRLAGLLRTEGGAPAAVLVVREMKFVGYTPAAMRMFELLLDWASRSLALVRRCAEAQARDIRVAGTDLASLGYLRSRMNEEIRRAARRGGSFACLGLRLGVDLTPAARARLGQVAARLLRHHTRLSDTLAYDPESSAFLLFLPDADRAGALAVRHKLGRALASFDFRPTPDGRPLQVQWGLAELMPDCDGDWMVDRVIAELDGSCEEDVA